MAAGRALRAVGQATMTLRAAVLCLAACAACATPAAKSPPADAQAADAKADAAAKSDCLPGAATLQGTCCPAGTWWTPTECAAVGPPECATGTADACQPRWCFSPQLADGTACPWAAAECMPVAHTCTDGELAAGAGCLAGFAPDHDGNCRAAGMGDESTATSATASVPALPPPEPPRACWDPDGDEPRPCQPTEKGCRVDEVADKTGACVPNTGTDLICPAGFVQVAAKDSDLLPTCQPDPAACGSDPYGGIAEAKGTVFVDAQFKGKPVGSRAAPFADLEQAAAALPDGGTVAVAAGTYPASLWLKAAVDVRGRCPAMVTLAPPEHMAAFWANSPAGSGSRLRGVKITGGENAIRATNGAKIAASGVWIAGTLSRGVLAADGGDVAFADGVITDVVGAKDLSTAGFAVLAELEGSHVSLLRVRLSRAADTAILARDDAAIDARDVVVDYGKPASVVNGIGSGIVADYGSQIVLRRVRVSHTGNRAVGALHAGTGLVASRLWVDHSVTPIAGLTGGQGLIVASGASAELAGVRINDCHSAAVLVLDAGTELKLTAAALLGTRTTMQNTTDGAGLVLAKGGAAQAHLLWVHDNRTMGVAVIGKGVQLSLTDALVGFTAAQDGSNSQGYGASVADGAAADFRRVRLSHNRGAGVYVSGAGTQVTGRDWVCDATQPDNLALPTGPGVYVEDLATLRVRGLRVSGSTTVGVSVATGSDVQLAGLLVEATQPEPASKDYGLGMVVQNGAQVRLHGARIHASLGAGLVVSGAGTQLAADGLAVTATQVRISDGGGGHGIYAALGANLVLAGALVVGNRSTGLAADHAALQADRAVIVATGFAPLVNPDLTLGQQLADGVVAATATGFAMRRSIVAGNARAGVLADATPAGTLQQTLVSGGLFGVVMQHGAQVQSQSVAVFGATQQNRAGDQGLAVPSPPVFVGAK